MAERSVFDKKPSMVAEILSGGAKGAGSVFTGMADFVMAAPVAGYKMAKGMPFQQAVESSTGMLTQALGLGEPTDKGSPEYLAYKAAQLGTPIGRLGAKGERGRGYAAQVGTNAALDMAGTYVPEGFTMPAALALMGGSAAVNRLRNNIIKDMGATPEALAAAKQKGITVGQETGNPEALRREAQLAVSPKRADKVAKFYKDQANSFKDTVDKVTAAITKTEPSDIKAVRSASERLTKLYEARQSELSKQFKADLQEAARLNGGSQKRFASNKIIVDEIDAIIADFKADTGTTVNDRIIKELESVKTRMQNQKGQYLTFKDFEVQQSSWSQRSAGKGTFIDNLDTDTNKVISARIANAFERTLDSVIDNPTNLVNKKAAEKLMETRSAYREAKQQMKDYAALPVNQILKTDNIYSLQGDELVSRIAKLPPESRKIAMDYLDKTAPELTENVRFRIMDNFREAGTIYGAAEKGAQFDPRQYLNAVKAAVDKDPNLVEMLFPNANDQREFTATIMKAQKQANSGEAFQLTNKNPALDAVGDVASLGAGYKGRIAARGVGSVTGTAEKVLLSDKDLFKALFEGKDIRKGWFNNYTKGMAKFAAGENSSAAAKQQEMQQQEPMPAETEEETLYKQFQATQQPAEGQTMEQPTQAPVEPPMAPNEEDLYKAFQESLKGNR